MATRILLAVLAIQFFLSWLAWPNALFLQPNLLSAISQILAYLPLLFFPLFVKDRPLFFIGGLSIMAIGLPPALYIFGLKGYPMVVALILVVGGLIHFLLGSIFSLMLARILKYSRWAFLLAAPVLFVTLEFANSRLAVLGGLLPTPGHLAGYPLLGVPFLAQLASVTGPAGLTFLVLFLAAAGASWLWPWLSRLAMLKPWISEPAVSPQPRFWLTGAGVAAVLALLVLIGNGEALKVSQQQSKPAKTIIPALLQSNVNPRNYGKIDAYIQKSTITYYRKFILEAAQRGAQLLVFPEEAMPGRVADLPMFWHDFRSTLAEVKLPGLFGTPLRMKDGRGFNMWFLTDPQGKIVDHYGKQFMVPFGEYMPFRSIVDPVIQSLNWAFDKTYRYLRLAAIDNEPWDLEPWKENRVFSWREGKLGVKVCDEIAFPTLFRQDVRQGAQVILSPTSGDWFDQPYYFYTYLLSTRARAIESRRWICRVSNCNASVIVDALGRVRHLTPFKQPAIQIETVPLLDLVPWYARVGDLFAWLCVAMTLAFFIPVFRGWKDQRAAHESANA